MTSIPVTRSPRFVGAFVAALMAAPSARAVNLVPNPGFEAITQCPTNQAQLAYAAPWGSPAVGTPDLYNVCATNPYASVPVNVVGVEAPHSGDGYAGFICYRVGVTVREYLQTPLSAPLAPGQLYNVSFYLSLGDNWGYAIDQVGVCLSVGAVGPYNHFNELPLTPQVTSLPGQFLTNQVGWTLVSGTYLAQGGEDHIVIGSFAPQSAIATQLVDASLIPGTYYFIDDVAVEVVPAPGIATFLVGVAAIGALRRSRCRVHQAVQDASNQLPCG